MNPLFILGGVIFGVGLLARALPDRVETIVMWGGAAIIAAGFFVDVTPVRFPARRKR